MTIVEYMALVDEAYEMGAIDYSDRAEYLQIRSPIMVSESESISRLALEVHRAMHNRRKWLQAKVTDIPEEPRFWT